MESLVILGRGGLVAHVLQRVRKAGELVGSRGRDRLADVEETHVADVIADGQLVAGRRPAQFVQGDVVGGSDRRRRHFHVRIQVPQVEPARDVDAGEHRRVNRAPADVQHVVGKVLERVDEGPIVGANGAELLGFGTPQFDGPVAR